MLRDPEKMLKKDLIAEVRRLRRAATAAGSLLIGGKVYGLRRVPKDLLADTIDVLTDEYAASDARRGENLWAVLTVDADDAPVPNEPLYAVRVSNDSEGGVTVHVAYVARPIARGAEGQTRYEEPAAE